MSELEIALSAAVPLETSTAGAFIILLACATPDTTAAIPKRIAGMLAGNGPVLAPTATAPEIALAVSMAICATATAFSIFCCL